MKLDFLLISATKMEQERIRARMEISGSDHPHGRPWHHGTLSGRSVLLVEGGVGQVNTAAALTLALILHQPVVILQFGVGGAYERSGITTGDLAIATEECYGDTGVMTPEGWLDMERMGFPMIPGQVDSQGRTLWKPLYNRIPLDSTLIEKIQQSLESGLEGEDAHGIEAGPFVTVQQCSGIKSLGDELAVRYDGICENMEGAAAAHVARINEVPFVEIRGISNRVVDRDLSQWDLPLAIRRCQQAVELIVEQGVP